MLAMATYCHFCCRKCSKMSVLGGSHCQLARDKDQSDCLKKPSLCHQVFVKMLIENISRKVGEKIMQRIHFVKYCFVLLVFSFCH